VYVPVEAQPTQISSAVRQTPETMSDFLVINLLLLPDEPAMRDGLSFDLPTLSFGLRILFQLVCIEAQ
jgi:hypothetical protein